MGAGGGAGAGAAGAGGGGGGADGAGAAGAAAGAAGGAPPGTKEAPKDAAAGLKENEEAVGFNCGFRTISSPSSSQESAILADEGA